MIYFIQAENGLIKIGFSKNVTSRLSNMQVRSPLKLTLLSTIKGTVVMEKELHYKFSKFREHGEWFKPTQDIINFIANPNIEFYSYTNIETQDYKVWEIPREKIFTKEEDSALLSVLISRKFKGLKFKKNNLVVDYYIFSIMRQPGLLLFQITNLLEGDFSKEASTIKFIGKGGDNKVIYLTENVALLINEWLRVKTEIGYKRGVDEHLFQSRHKKGFSTRQIQKKAKQLFLETGLDSNHSVHSFRHTYRYYSNTQDNLTITGNLTT